MKDLGERYVKKFLDVISLSILKDKSLSGSDIIRIIYENFKILLSPGTLYPVLHSLEKKGLVKRKRYGKKKIYTITNKGRTTLKDADQILRNLRMFRPPKKSLFSKLQPMFR